MFNFGGVEKSWVTAVILLKIFSKTFDFPLDFAPFSPQKSLPNTQRFAEKTQIVM